MSVHEKLVYKLINANMNFCVKEILSMTVVAQLHGTDRRRHVSTVPQEKAASDRCIISLNNPSHCYTN